METTQTSKTIHKMTNPTPVVRWKKALKKAFWLTAGLAILALLPLVLVSLGYMYYRTFGLIMPGVRVRGMPLEGLTVDQAVSELDRVWNQEFRITAVDNMDANRVWIVSPAEFGLGVDPHATATQAYSVGRGEGLISGIATWLHGFREHKEITPWVYLNTGAAKLGLEHWSQVLAIPSVEGELSIHNGEVAQQSGEDGVALDLEASLALLIADPSAILLEYRFVPLMTVPVAPAILDVSATAAEIENLLAADIALRAFDPISGEHFEWRPAREIVASWLDLQRLEKTYTFGIDDSQINRYLDSLDNAIGAERTFDHENALTNLKLEIGGSSAEPLLIHYLPTTYRVKPGDNLVSIGFKVGMPYWRLLDENPVVARRGLRVGETIIVPAKDVLLDLPIVMDKRIVISIREQKMWVYQDGNLIKENIVSTGISKSPTLPGVFQIRTHIPNAYASIWDLYMPHFLGIYYATPDLLNGIHGLPLLSSGERLWADVLGRPASYGCIILDLYSAAELYNWAEDGVIVEIQK